MRIKLNLRSLLDKLLEMDKDKVSYVELHLVPGQIDEGIQNPAFLHFDGITKRGEYRDYESIDEVSLSEYLKIHKSA